MFIVITIKYGKYNVKHIFFLKKRKFMTIEIKHDRMDKRKEGKYVMRDMKGEYK